MRTLRGSRFPYIVSRRGDGSVAGTNYGSSVSIDGVATAAGTQAGTYAAKWYPRGTNASSFHYFLAKDSAGTRGRRFLWQQATGQAIQFGVGSTGVANAPVQLAADNTIPVSSGWWTVFATWNGGLLKTDIRLYGGLNGATPSEFSYNTTGLDGTGSIVSDAANSLSVGYRADNGDRATNGDLAWTARWLPILSPDEMALVQRWGPLAVQRGLQFAGINEWDYGPNFLLPTARSAFLIGDYPMLSPVSSAGLTWIPSGGAGAVTMVMDPLVFGGAI